MNYVVAGHHHDEHAEVYVLTIGVPEDVEVPLLNQDGAQAVDGDGVPLMTTETRVRPTEDFVFSSFDPQWAGKSPEEVVADQRRIVKRQLRARRRAAEATARPLASMPGVGEVL